MKIRTSPFRPLAVCVAAILIASSASGQATLTKPGESYNFVLQLIAGGQGSSVKDKLPAGWDKVEKQLRSTFSVKGFETIGTFVVRGTVGGSAGYEGRWDGLANKSERSPTIRYSFSGLSQSNGKIVAESGSFLLAVLLPVDRQQPVAPRDEQGFRITFNDLAFEPNTPTVLGSLQIGGVEGPVFVVLTAKTP
ncbi:MAG: hypothetical protein R2682_02725 [Pyrinomonadaceae bacterium]